MGKYETITRDFLSVFGDSEWVSLGINTYPGDFIAKDAGNRYIRVSILPSGFGINRASVSGQVIIDIFTPAGNGPIGSATIADALDAFLVGRSKAVGSGYFQMTSSSALSHRGRDTANPALNRAQYAINFSFFGV